jgi:Bacterial PH domain
VERQCKDANVVTDSRVVLRVSPIAHLAVAFFTLGLLIPVLTWPPSAPLLVIPVVLSTSIVWLRTVADEQGVTVRNLRGSRTVSWDDVEGLRFSRGSWGRARLKSGDELRLPAVTFATLPRLTEVSAGRVPNPYG